MIDCSAEPVLEKGVFESIAPISLPCWHQALHPMQKNQTLNISKQALQAPFSMCLKCLIHLYEVASYDLAIWIGAGMADLYFQFFLDMYGVEA